MGLSTIYLFKLSFTTDSTDDQINNSINTATSYIEQYLDRNLENQEYTETLDVYDGLVQLTEYPVTKIKNVLNNYNDAILVQTDDTIYQAVFSSNNTSLSITTTDNSSQDTETILNYSSYANLASLSTAIDNISGITSSVLTVYESTPSKYLSPINKIMGKSAQMYLYSWVRDTGNTLNYMLDPETTRNLLINDFCNNIYKYIYVNYLAGYICPVDNSDHTALSISGNVPLDITDICNRLSYIILDDMSNGIKSGYYKSEELGDYSYTLSDSAKSSIDTLIISFEDNLSKYKKTWLMG
jgi:hypothetical protein